MKHPLLFVLLASLVALPAAAQTIVTVPPAAIVLPPATPTAWVNTADWSLVVGKAGSVTLRGTLVATSTDTLTVRSWGGDWTIRIAPNASFLPAGLSRDRYELGDKIGVAGDFGLSAPLSITGRTIRDWTEKKKAPAVSLLPIATGKERILVATVRAVPVEVVVPPSLTGTSTASTTTSVATSSTPFLLSLDGKDFALVLTSNAKVVDRLWKAMTLADVRAGDTLRLFARTVGTQVIASVVRDVTAPR